MAHKFKKNDKVLVISGSDKGKKGNIKAILKDRVTIEGVNIATIHKKATNAGPGQILKVEKSIHISNISHFDDKGPIRVKFNVDSGEGKIFARKSRISKKTGKKID